MRFRGGAVGTLSVRLHAFSVIARHRRCRGNPIEDQNPTTHPSDSHAHSRSLGMTRNALFRHCEEPQATRQSDRRPGPYDAPIGFPRSLPFARNDTERSFPSLRGIADAVAIRLKTTTFRRVSSGFPRSLTFARNDPPKRWVLGGGSLVATLSVQLHAFPVTAEIRRFRSTNLSTTDSGSQPAPSSVSGSSS